MLVLSSATVCCLKSWIGRSVRELILDLFVAGRPRTKGSLKVITPRGRKPLLVEDHALSKPWRIKVIKAIRAKYPHPPAVANPVDVYLTFHFERLGPQARTQDWPMVNAGVNAIGDLDKLERNVLDAMEDAGVYVNDCQVVQLNTRKQWTQDTPGVEIKVWAL